jgi:hypothetical protein
VFHDRGSGDPAEVERRTGNRCRDQVEWGTRLADQIRITAPAELRGALRADIAPAACALANGRHGRATAPVEGRFVAIENGSAGFDIASCNAGCRTYGLLSLARRLAR